MTTQAEFAQQRALQQQMLARALSQGYDFKSGDVPAKAWQPVIQQFGAMMAGKRLKGQEAEAQGRFKNILANILEGKEVSAPVPAVEGPLPETGMGPGAPQTGPDVTTRVPYTQQEKMRMAIESPDLQPLVAKQLFPNKENLPSAAQEYNIWKNLPTKKDQEDYLRVKRAQQFLDVGSGFVAPNMTDPTQTRPVATRNLKPSEQPSYLAEKAGTEKAAELTAADRTKAALDLPRIESAGNEMLKLTDELLKHPGKKYAVGTASVAPMIPGTDQANFITRLNQIGGKQFLQAYETLKGGGQITEVEGKKATDAMARMSRAQTAEEFDRSVRDFQDVVRAGMERARTRTGRRATDRPAGPNIDDLLNKY